MWGFVCVYVCKWACSKYFRNHGDCGSIHQRDGLEMKKPIIHALLLGVWYGSTPAFWSVQSLLSSIGETHEVKEAVLSTLFIRNCLYPHKSCPGINSETASWYGQKLCQGAILSIEKYGQSLVCHLGSLYCSLIFNKVCAGSTFISQKLLLTSILSWTENRHVIWTSDKRGSCLNIL